MSVDFSQLIEATFFSVWEAFKKIEQGGGIGLRNVFVDFHFSLDISPGIKEPLAVQSRSNSCFMGLRGQNDEASCELTLNLKRRVV